MTAKRGKLDVGWGKKEEPAATSPAQEPSTAVVPAAAPTEKRERKPKGVGEEIGINLRLSPAAWTALGVLAAKQRRAKQDLLLEALDLVLARYGEEPVARKR